LVNAMSLFTEFFSGTGRFAIVGDLIRASLIIFAALFPMIYMAHVFSAGGILAMIERVKDDLLMIKGLFEGLFWIFEWIWQRFREIYGFIKSHIPTLGGT